MQEIALLYLCRVSLALSRQLALQFALLHLQIAYMLLLHLEIAYMLLLRLEIAGVLR
jgi:hypothetical protein